MLYVVALLCPPLAVLLCGRPFTAVVVLLLSVVYFPGALVALLVVSGHYADRRSDRSADRIAGQIHRGQVASTRQNWAIYQAAERQARAGERQAELLARAIEGRAPAPALPPAPAPALEVEAITDEAPPRKPIGEVAREAIGRARYAYDSLPEWAQPVVWGLAAATPAVLLLVALMAAR